MDKVYVARLTPYGNSEREHTIHPDRPILGLTLRLLRASLRTSFPYMYELARIQMSTKAVFHLPIRQIQI